MVKVAEKVETDLIRDNMHASYFEQIKSQLDRGVAVKLSAEEVLTALTLLSRLVVSVVIALQKLDYTLTSSIMIADSKCAISAVRSTKSHLPYFQNRVAKTRENMEFVRKFSPWEMCTQPS